MNPLVKKGRKHTAILIGCIILFSAINIILYQVVVPDAEEAQTIQQSIRFLLTLGLMYAVYLGKQWARVLAVIFFSLAIVLAIHGLFKPGPNFTTAVPILVMIVVYSLAIYHLVFAASFVAFQNWQQKKVH